LLVIFETKKFVIKIEQKVVLYSRASVQSIIKEVYDIQNWKYPMIIASIFSFVPIFDYIGKLVYRAIIMSFLVTKLWILQNLIIDQYS